MTDFGRVDGTTRVRFFFGCEGPGTQAFNGGPYDTVEPGALNHDPATWGQYDWGYEWSSGLTAADAGTNTIDLSDSGHAWRVLLGRGASGDLATSRSYAPASGEVGSDPLDVICVDDIDVILGSDAPDVLQYDANRPVTIHGNAGADMILSYDGQNADHDHELHGGDGDGILAPDPGIDTVDGGAGIVTGTQEVDYIGNVRA